MSNVVLDGTTGPEDTGSRLARSEIFDILQNERRRLVLRYLQRNDTDVELGDLATQVAAREYETSVEAVSAEQRKRVYTTLQQTHLPKMDSVGIVAFDRDRGVVAPTEHTQALSVYLEIVPGNELAWREYYLLLGAAGCSLAIGLWASIPPLTALPAALWLGGYALLVLVSALANSYHEQTMRLGDGSSPHDALFGRD
jgi:hypothetical protein